MTGQTTTRLWVLVTGSTDGIGRQTAIELARAGHHVLVHGRDLERVHDAVARAAAAGAATGGDVRGFVADFSSLADVRSLASDVRTSVPRLDVLVNNAGTFCDQRVVTVDGNETTLAVNHLAAFLLTALLTDVLAAGAPARVVTVASVAHQSAQLDFADLQSAFHYSGYNAYALSKLCNVLFAYELADRLADAGVTANCLHPGVVSTKLLRRGFPGLPGASVIEGARTSVYLATSQEVAQITGTYFVDRRPARSSALSYDLAARRRLWRVSEQLVGTAPRPVR